MSVVVDNSPAKLRSVCYLITKMSFEDVEKLAKSIESVRNAGLSKECRIKVTGSVLHVAAKKAHAEAATKEIER